MNYCVNIEKDGVKIHIYRCTNTPTFYTIINSDRYYVCDKHKQDETEEFKVCGYDVVWIPIIKKENE